MLHSGEMFFAKTQTTLFSAKKLKVKDDKICNFLKTYSTHLIKVSYVIGNNCKNTFSCRKKKSKLNS